jgi:hypothetical protein
MVMLFTLVTPAALPVLPGRMPEGFDARRRAEYVQAVFPRKA